MSELPKRFPDRDEIAAVRAEAERAEPGQTLEEEHRVAGRVMARREMGKLSFLDLVDRSARIQLIVRDKDCRGLALIVNVSSMAWSYAYRPRGTDPLTGRRWPNRALTLGNPSTHSPDDARVEANRIKGQAAAGGLQ